MLEGLTDADELVAHLKRATTAEGLVLHGHLHRRQSKILSRDRARVQVVGATSASLHHHDRDRMAGFNVYEIETDGRVSCVDARVFDPDSSSFATADIPQISHAF
jgi:hypothetical protein